MKKTSLSVSLALFWAFSSHAAPINASDSGWYDQNGQHNPAVDNFFTGVLGGDEQRSFFVFNLAGITAGSITSANLTLSNRDTTFQNLLLAGTFGAPFTLNMFDVSSSVADVTGNVNGVSVFNDLGAGTLLGSLGIANTNPGNVVINLNAGGIAHLNSRAGGTVILALALAAPGVDDQFIFANEGNAGEFGNSTRILNIETAPETPGTPTPEPTTSTLMLGAGAALALWTRSRRAAPALRSGEDPGAPAHR